MKKECNIYMILKSRCIISRPLFALFFYLYNVLLICPLLSSLSFILSLSPTSVLPFHDSATS